MGRPWRNDGRTLVPYYLGNLLQEVKSRVGEMPAGNAKVAKEDDDLARAVKEGKAFGLAIYGADEATTSDAFAAVVDLIENKFPQYCLENAASYGI